VLNSPNLSADTCFALCLTAFMGILYHKALSRVGSALDTFYFASPMRKFVVLAPVVFIAGALLAFFGDKGDYTNSNGNEPSVIINDNGLDIRVGIDDSGVAVRNRLAHSEESIITKQKSSQYTSLDTSSSRQEAMHLRPITQVHVGRFMLVPPAESNVAVEKELSQSSQIDSAKLTRKQNKTSNYNKEVTFGKGDALGSVLSRQGVGASAAHAVATAMKPVLDPRKLRAGQKMTLSFMPSDNASGKPSLQQLMIDGRDAQITISRKDNGTFVAQKKEKELQRKYIRAGGIIRNSLSHLARNEMIPASVLSEAVKAYGFDVDFRRDIRKGDGFAVVYEAFYNDQSKFVRNGRMVYAELTLDGERKRLYSYGVGHKNRDYFDEKGRSVRKNLLKNPVPGARESSGYGMRFHPILKRKMPHRGLDFAAKTGTPIRAAGTGRVVLAQRKGAYGKYIRIRHDSTWSTAYAHINRFAKGIRKGVHVRQGQVIAYVGTTGRSTGPHLHYEVLKHGKQVNPKKVPLRPGRILRGTELVKFHNARQKLDILFASLAPDNVGKGDVEVAGLGDGDDRPNP